MKQKHSYQNIFSALKTTGHYACDDMRMIAVITNAGIATFDGLYLRKELPNVAHTAIVDRVLVSHWSKGERAGKFGQAKHEVVSRKSGWVTYLDTTGRKHTVRAEYTKAVA